MDAPEAPDPMKTAQAQAQMNRETAITQYGLNATNQKTPWGALNYSQIGKWEDGTPRYQAEQTLNPQIQGIVDNALGIMQQPIDFSNDEVEGRLMELGRQRLDPLMAQRRGSTEQDLFNRGVRPGSEAYDRAMRGVGQDENDAYTQLMLQGRGQALNEMQMARNLPLNEAIALMTGGQSGYINTPGAQVAPVDYTGLVNQQYQSEVANSQAGMSGLFGLGSALISAPIWSDERLKEDIQRVGQTDDGRPIYTYKMKGSPQTQMGVMAQENPDIAIEEPNTGMLQVDYAQLGSSGAQPQESPWADWLRGQMQPSAVPFFTGDDPAMQSGRRQAKAWVENIGQGKFEKILQGMANPRVN